ncbi:hypothetical protein ACFWN1_20145 [Streptomyces sp. NPDC058459]|uniref:hypothetical protein n=1 Tax=Streptomyces sp. NPDC058459 TaxID=3346508 RepID=UPI00365A4CD8
MDAISAELLVALATGAAGEAGQQLWISLSAMVRRRARPEDIEPGAVEPATGEAELLHLSAASHDIERARSLSSAVRRRAEHDLRFRADVALWQRQAQALRREDGMVSNVVSGTQRGPVVQGRDFFGITFNEGGRGEGP